MRSRLTILALLLALFASPAVCRADEYDDERGEGKKSDAKRGTPEEELRREQKRWAVWVKKLGDGPIYRVEVLFRGKSSDDNLYFAQHYVSPSLPLTHGMPALGLDAKGKIVPPYDPGHEQLAILRDLEKRSKTDVSPPPPLARTTRYLGVSLERDHAKTGDAGIRVSDVLTCVRLPKKVGDVEICFFDRAMFRLERVSAADVLKAGPLRQDAKYVRDRRDALKRDIRLRRTKDVYEWSVAASIFGDPVLIDGVRQALDQSIALPPGHFCIALPGDFSTHPFPSYLTQCLAEVGDARDFKAFRRLMKRHPEIAIMSSVLELVQRVGTAKAMPLLEDLLKNPANWDFFTEDVELLFRLDDKVPLPTRGDYFFREAITRFKLKPSCYGLSLAQHRLAALKDRHPFTEEEVKAKKDAVDGDWLFLTEADRRQGIELLLDWFKQYEPPAKK